MSKRKAVRFTVRFIALGIAAGTLAGYSAYAKRSTRAPGETAGATLGPQIANRSVKTDRLAFLVRAAAAMPVTEMPVTEMPVAEVPATATAVPAIENKVYALASATQSDDLAGLTGIVNTSLPTSITASPEPAPAAAPAEIKHAAIAPAPIPHEKPKRVAPPAPPAASNLLDDNQIAGLRGRLRLTSDQVEYWPAVETALRDVVRTQLRGTAKSAHGGKVNIDVNSAEVQKLIWAAMPLLMRLRDDQKNEVRKLARVIGLDQVASQI